MKLVLLNIRRIGDKPCLGYDLTGKLTDFFSHNSPTLEIKLESGTIYLSKWAYLNNYRVYQSPVDRDCFFLVFGYKRPNNKLALEKLLRHGEKQRIPVIKQRSKLKKTA